MEHEQAGFYLQDIHDLFGTFVVFTTPVHGVSDLPTCPQAWASSGLVTLLVL